MLHIQKFLRDGGTLQELKDSKGINSYEHPTLPLVGLKYDQIESKKTDPIVRECRGIVLEKGSFDVVSKGFNRFFNLGEDQENFNFNWSDFSCNTKEDGSVIFLYHYNNEWHVNTSGSFGLGECNFSGKTWRQLFWETFGVKQEDAFLEPDFTHVFELWTPYNKVVRTYPKPSLFLLSLFNKNDGSELDANLLSDYATFINNRNKSNVQTPQTYTFKSEVEIMSFLREKESTDPTFEGVVIRDDKNVRAKVKSATYVAIHHLMDNGNIFNPKRQVPIILAGETSEAIVILKRDHPEIGASMDKTRAEIESEWEKLKIVWESSYRIEDQKTFALTIKDKTPFTGLLFGVRKQYGKGQTIDHLKSAWRDSADIIVKRLYE